MSKKTPLQMAVTKCRGLYKSHNVTIQQSSILMIVIGQLEALLPDEKEFAKECYNEGWADNGLFDNDFEQFYSVYENQPK